MEHKYEKNIRERDEKPKGKVVEVTIRKVGNGYVSETHRKAANERQDGPLWHEHREEKIHPTMKHAQKHLAESFGESDEDK